MPGEFKLSSMAKDFAHKMIDKNIKSSGKVKGDKTIVQSVRRAAHLAVNGKLNAAVREVNPLTSKKNNIVDHLVRASNKLNPMMAPYSALIGEHLKSAGSKASEGLMEGVGITDALSKASRAMKGFDDY